MRNKEVAVYKGEEIIAMGTVRECAIKLNVKEKTIYFYTTPAYRRKLAARKNSRNALVAEWLEDDE